MKSLTLNCFFFFISIPILVSQGLIIEYDHEKNQLKYYQGDKEINGPVVKSGQKIELRVINYNNYLYEVDIEEQQNERKIGLDQSFLNQIGSKNVFDLTDEDGDGVINLKDQEPFSPPGFDVDAIGSVASVPFILEHNILDEATLEIWKKYEEARLDFERQQLEIEREKLRIEAERRKEEMIVNFINRIETEVSKLKVFRQSLIERNEEIVEIQSSERNIMIAEEQVNQLKYNPQLKVSTIKSQGTSILGTALQIEDLDDADLSEIKEVHNYQEQLEALIKENQLEREDYGNKLKLIEPIGMQLSELAPERSAVKVALNDLEQAFLQYEDYTQSSAELEELMKSELKYFEERDDVIITVLWSAYDELRNNSFTDYHITRAEKDEVVLRIILRPKNGGNTDIIPETIEINPVRIPVYGGFKINTSVGLNFTRFADPPKNYFINDGRIVSQSGDVFTPFVTSYLHFYFQGMKSISWGGSMGIGIPMGGDSGLESTSFFLGPSLFMGNSNRIIINLGLMGGKVGRLGGGLLEGDLVPVGQSFIPEQSNYNLGYYIGLSFNLKG